VGDPLRAVLLATTAPVWWLANAAAFKLRQDQTAGLNYHGSAYCPYPSGTHTSLAA